MQTVTFPTVKMSKASKMPCQSYSIPAAECKVGGTLRGVKGSTCEKCYARKGRYLFGAVMASRYHNFEHLMLCQRDADARANWVRQIAGAVANDRFMRWHDSGDLQGLWHLEMIVEVAKAAPWCQFWLPTREYAVVTDYLLEHGNFPGNLTVRLSALMRGKPMMINSTMAAAGVVGSTVGFEGGSECPAYHRDGKCGDCRACWDRSVASVNYPLH